MKYKCKLCAAEYELNGLVNHIQRTHKIKYRDYYETYIEKGPHVCKFCGEPAIFTSCNGFKDHCAKCVRKQQVETKKLNFVKKEKPRRTDCEYECALCNAQFKTVSVLNRHVIRYHKEISTEEYHNKYLNVQPAFCEICGKKAKWCGVGYSNVCGSAECTHALRVKNNAMNNPSIRKKVGEIQKTFSEEKKAEIRTKRENTLFEKTGYAHNWQNPASRDLCLKTMKERYGTTCGASTPKAKSTMMKKYGVEHFSQSVEFAKTRKYKYEINGHSFDSKDEAFVFNFTRLLGSVVELHPDTRFTYDYDGKEHYYEPDFCIDGKYYEFKGLQFFKDKDSSKRMINPFDRTLDDLYEAKHQCMIKNNVIILTDTNIFSLFKNIYDITINEEILFDRVFGQPFPGTKKWPAEHPIWDCFLPGRKSPKEAWSDELLIKKAIKNLIKILIDGIMQFKYDAFCKKHLNAIKNNETIFNELVLNRFTIAKIAPKVTALNENDFLRIIKETGKDISNGVYCPMAGFGGIIRGTEKWFNEKGIEPNIEAYDINESFCKWYGWKQRDVLTQVIETDKTVIVCPPFGKEFEHWKGTPDEMSDITFIEWVRLIKEHVKAPDYIFIGPETHSKNICGLFSKTTGIAYYEDKT